MGCIIYRTKSPSATRNTFSKSSAVDAGFMSFHKHRLQNISRVKRKHIEVELCNNHLSNIRTVANTTLRGCCVCLFFHFTTHKDGYCDRVVSEAQGYPRRTDDADVKSHHRRMPRQNYFECRPS